MNETTGTMNPDTSDIHVLRQAMLFSLTRHTWTNRHKADKSRIVTGADKAQLNLSKRLLRSKELDALNKFMGEAYDWCFERAMPSSTIRKGIYFVRRTMVSDFERHLTVARLLLHKKYVPAFLATYDACKERMKAPDALGELYVEDDYPKARELARRFDLRWSWLALSVPEELPEEVRVREIAKLRDSFGQAQEEIKYALRAGFKSLVDHAVERLTVKPGERPKLFKDSVVDNFKRFFDTFDARNLMDDAALAGAVQSAREVVAGIPSASILREADGLRASAAQSFAEINEIVAGLVSEVPARRFDLEDEP